MIVRAAPCRLHAHHSRDSLPRRGRDSRDDDSGGGRGIAGGSQTGSGERGGGGAVLEMRISSIPILCSLPLAPSIAPASRPPPAPIAVPACALSCRTVSVVSSDEAVADWLFGLLFLSVLAKRFRFGGAL